MGAILKALFGGKKKDNGIAIDQSLASRIPYIRCYEDEGIIETTEGNFSKSYIIGSPDETSATNDAAIAAARQSLALLMNDFPNNVSFEFSTHNMLISEEKYLKQILIVPDKEPELNPYIEEYNNVVSDNVDVGHNNIKKTTYFTVNIRTAFVDDAIKLFQELDPKIKERFKDIYNIEVKGLNLIARLRILYNMFNPGVGNFGQKIDLKGDGEIDLKNLKYMHLSSKDIVAPVNMNTSFDLKDHLILNVGTEDETFVRVYGITNIPRDVSDNVISDLTNVSSSMVYSTIYETIDTELGYETSKNLVVKNTITETKMKRATVAERKAHATEQIKKKKERDEDTYFEEKALELFQKNWAATQKTFAVTFVVCLYAPSMEDLNRDSELLKLSADKFSFKLKSLDVQQLQGFQTVLPLCSNRIDLKRVIDMDRLVTMSPINMQDMIKRGGAYNGLNAINDNLILINRRNSRNTAGAIAGVSHSGKTYQSKKEVFNAMATTTDDVSIIAFGNEYDDFVKTLGGGIVDSMHVNIFEMIKGYGLADRDNNPEKDIIFKSYFLDALFVAMQDYKVSNRLLLSDDAISGDPNHTEISEIEAEVAELIQYIDKNGIDTGNEQTIYDYIETSGTFTHLKDSLSKKDTAYLDGTGGDEKKRLMLYKVQNKTDLLLVLDYLRNKALSDLHTKKENPYNWVFVDPIDKMLEDSASSDYLNEYIYKSNLTKTVFTMVIQDSVKLVSNQTTQLPFEDMVNECGYFKLLSLGPIERRKYIELLSIPQALIQYISNVEPGKGIIITSETNVAFDDSFLAADNKYHLLFAKEIQQIVLNEKLHKKGEKP